VENKEVAAVVGKGAAVNGKAEKKPKKRKNSLRRETIHNLTNKINLNFSRRRNEEEEGGDEGEGVEEERTGSQDSDADADDFFAKEANRNHKVVIYIYGSSKILKVKVLAIKNSIDFFKNY
jgi:hypothetical protein